MPYLILIVGVALGIYGLYRFFLNADVQQVKAFFLTVITGTLVIALLLMALTGRLGAALGLFIALLPFAMAWRRRKLAEEAPAPSGPMTRKEALEVLGLADPATTDDIQTAYKKLMQKVHPDSQGSDWMAAKLNQARDILLK